MPGYVKNMYYFQHNSDEILTFKNKSPTNVFTLLCFVGVVHVHLVIILHFLKEKAKNWLYLYNRGKMHHNFNTLQRLVLIFYNKKTKFNLYHKVMYLLYSQHNHDTFIDKNWIKNYWKKFWNSHSSNLLKMKSRTEK